MIKMLHIALFALVSMLPASLSFAAEQQIGFQIWSGPVPPMSLDPETNVAKANTAFLAKYGREAGLLGTSVGRTGDLIILVADQFASRRLWNKMLGAGDAYSAGNGVGYFVFGEPTPPTPPATPQPTYDLVGRVNVLENTTGRFTFINGTPAIKGYLLVIHESCPIVRSGVEVAIPGTSVQPTRLVKKTRNGRNTFVYQYSVNGDLGAVLAAVDVTIGTVGGPVIAETCAVDIYTRSK